MNPEQLREVGNWIVELKNLLGMNATFGNRPKQKHRSTKSAVRLLLTNLHEGAQTKPDPAVLLQTEREHANKLVFNAVDLLMDDKVAKSKKGKTKLQALARFQTMLNEQFEEQSRKPGALDRKWKAMVGEAVAALRYEEMEKGFLNGTVPPQDMLDEDVIRARYPLRAQIINANDPAKLQEPQKSFWFDEAEKIFGHGISADTIVTTERGRLLLEAKPKLRSRIAASLDPAHLDEFLNRYPDAKSDLASSALLSVAGKTAGSTDQPLNRDVDIDPALFTKLKTHMKPAEWNDKARGLGPRVCQSLWKTGNYAQIAELIEYGVDTSLTARFPGLPDPSSGIYSGFFQPMEHVVQKHLKDVALLDDDPCPLTGEALSKAQGAKIILDALKKKGSAKTVTSWDEVKKSEMVKEFKKAPGTIWGFEDVRLPFVQASHETKKGAQPIRMMELWEAVEASLSPSAFSELLADPGTAADKFVDIGIEKIEEGIKSGEPKYAEIAEKKDKYISEFRRQAKSFLLEFSSQMPKMAFTKPSLTDPGNSPIALSDIAGVQAGKFGGGLACKAGLWWAKQEKKPVYYCLDGIDMNDVINYKKVKNKAIEEFISAGGKRGVKGHDEVITLVELREIIKNWEDLKDTVKFVQKGKIIEDDGTLNELTTMMDELQKKLKRANKRAGRQPAPDRGKFANELQAIDPGLSAKLDVADEPDMDARDIVKKSTYLVNIANTRPQIVLKYLMSRCTVLLTYKLISDDVPRLAAQLVSATEKEAGTILEQLLTAINQCSTTFRKPLETALIRHPANK